jgi:hypothetical protein
VRSRSVQASEFVPASNYQVLLGKLRKVISLRLNWPGFLPILQRPLLLKKGQILFLKSKEDAELVLYGE